MKTKNTKYKNILMGAILALPAISMADVSVTTSITGSANDVVGGGGSYVGKLTFGGTAQTIIVNSGTLQDDGTGGRNFDMLGTNNVFTFTGSSTQSIVNGGQNWNTGSTKISGTGNTLNILAGATFTANGWNGLDGSDNTINVDGSGSIASFSANGGDGFGNTSGSDAYTTNRVNITNGGTVYISGSGLSNLTATTGAGNYAVNVNGAGGRSVLGVSQIQYNGAAQGGIAHIFNGGALETRGGNPNQFGLGNQPNPQLIFIDGGVLSYKDASAVQMNESTSGNASSFTYAGNNAMRLNNSASTDTGSYTLANNLGTKNYVRLEMIGTTTSVARSITIDGANGGSILLDGTSATITNGVTLSGASTFTAMGADSTLTGLLSGGGTLIKAGSAKLTLGTSESYTGNTQIDAGILSISAAFLADNADVLIANSAFFNLTTGTSDTIDQLFLGGVEQAAGVYGALLSGAQYQITSITGSGTLNVVTGVPEPGTAVSLLGGLGMLLGLRRRRNS